MNVTEIQQLNLWEIAATAFYQKRLGLNKRQAQLFLALDSINTTCTDLAEVLNTTPSAVSRMTAKLFSLGLVERDDYNPREKVSFHLTPKGQTELEIFLAHGRSPRKHYRPIDRSILPVMSKEEIDKFNVMM
jgi:DNA-binding MarR family transcriptional regulator